MEEAKRCYNDTMFAELVINIEAALQGTFHYDVPPDLRPFLQIGHLVEVEFGRRLAQGIVVSAGGANGRVWGLAARVAILVLAVTMALRQLGLASDIVDMAFGLILGAIALSAALAFGLGGREVAGRELDRVVSEWRSDENEAAE